MSVHLVVVAGSRGPLALTQRRPRGAGRGSSPRPRTTWSHRREEKWVCLGFRVGGRWKVLWVASFHVGRRVKLIQVAVGRRPSALRLLDHQSHHGLVPSELPAFYISANLWCKNISTETLKINCHFKIIIKKYLLYVVHLIFFEYLRN